MTRVLVADDHAFVRDSLGRLLASDAGVEVVGAAADGGEAVALAAERRADVVLMDIEMPGLDGISATERLVRERPDTRVVMLTTFADPDRIAAALDAGAAGYLLKDAEPQEIVRAVHAAARGESPLAPRAARAVLADRAPRRKPGDLTPREHDVLALVASGLPNKLIARELGISPRTVKGHLTHIFQRIGVTDRTHAALWAVRHGVVRRD